MNPYACKECNRIGEELDDIYKGKDYIYTLYKCKKCNGYYFVKDMVKIINVTPIKRKDSTINPGGCLAIIVGVLIAVGLFIHYYLEFSVFAYVAIISIIMTFSFIMYFIPWIIVQFVEELFK